MEDLKAGITLVMTRCLYLMYKSHKYLMPNLIKYTKEKNNRLIHYYWNREIEEKDTTIGLMITGGAKYWPGLCEIMHMTEIQEIPICVVECLDYIQSINMDIYVNLIKKYAKYNIILIGYSVGGVMTSHIVKNTPKEYQENIKKIITFDSPLDIKNAQIYIETICLIDQI
jgi:hypothetical protein